MLMSPSIKKIMKPEIYYVATVSYKATTFFVHEKENVWFGLV